MSEPAVAAREQSLRRRDQDQRGMAQNGAGIRELSLEPSYGHQYGGGGGPGIQMLLEYILNIMFIIFKLKQAKDLILLVS